MGWLISISGIDGSGKTTLVHNLKKRFEQYGISVRLFGVRLGFTRFVEWIKNTFGGEKFIVPSTDYSAPDAPLERNIKEKIIWQGYCLVSLVELIILLSWISILRSFGRRIITDRYYWDNLIIYQNKFGQPKGLMKVLWLIAQAISRMPDVAFFLSIRPEDSYNRILVRNRGEEEQSLEVLKRRSQMFDDLDHLGLIIIDALKSPEKLVDIVCQELEDRELIPKVGGRMNEPDEETGFPQPLLED